MVKFKTKYKIMHIIKLDLSLALVFKITFGGRYFCRHNNVSALSRLSHRLLATTELL